MTAKILLDVDGVLNDCATRPPKEYFKTFKSQNGFEICFDEEITSRLNDMDEGGLVEIVWLTTWENLANLYLSDQFGFRRKFDVLYDFGVSQPYGGSKFSQNRGWWKFHHAKEYAKSGDKIVWIDDEINGERQYNENFKVWEDANPNVLTISPDPCLTHKDLDLVEEFLRD